jgi:hypothetical protein
MLWVLGASRRCPSSMSIFSTQIMISVNALALLYTKNCFLNVRFLVVIMQFNVTITTNCLALTRCIKVSYVEGNEWARNLFSVPPVYFVSTVLSTFGCGCVKCSILLWRDYWLNEHAIHEKCVEYGLDASFDKILWPNSSHLNNFSLSGLLWLIL